MRKLFIIILLIISHIGYSQDNGAIRTKTGLLLYFNLAQNSHTLNLEGDIDVSNFPFIKQNSIWFQFMTTSKNDFDTNSLSPLENYMKWEFEYMENQLSQKLTSTSKRIKINNSTANFWHFNNPKISNEQIHTQVKVTYFLDLIHNDLIYRFTYASTTGDNAEAFEILSGIAENLNFYITNIDLEKLQSNIIEGKNYYK